MSLRTPLQQHIDSNIILSNPKTKQGLICHRYLNKCGNIYSAKISFIALGEVMHRILFKLKTEDQDELFRLVREVIKERNIQICTMPNDIKILEEAIDLGRDPNDTLILACAVSDGAHDLVTTDKKLRDLKKFKNTRIVHPKDLP